MKGSTIVLLVGFVALAGGFLLAYAFDAFSPDTLTVSVGLCLIVVIGTWWAQSQYGKDYAKEDHKKDFNYYWDSMNRVLEKQRGDTLEWDSGVGNQSHVKTFTIGKELVEFQSFYAYLSRARQQVVVIINRKTLDIWRFYADPSPALIEDPFYGFKPYENPMENLAMRGMLGSRYSKKNRGIRIMMDNDDYGNQFEPDDDMVDRVSNGGDNH